MLEVDFFMSAPFNFRKSLLDILYILLRRNVLDVIRFQCFDQSAHSVMVDVDLIGLLLRLLENTVNDIKNEAVMLKQPLFITKRIIHLIGVVATAGISSTNLKKYLSLLKKPSELSVSLLQSLAVMIRHDTGVAKATPNTFFNFGGAGAGLVTDASPFPFTREYHFCTWFRVENFEEDLGVASSVEGAGKAFNSADRATQHIMSWSNSTQRGIDVYLEKRVLTVAISNHHGSKVSDTPPLLLRLSDYPLRRGVWYHISLRHAKPRMTLFANDELTVHLDQQVVFQDSVRFPVLGAATDTEFSFGRNLDGQMTPVYFFSEALPPLLMETVARLDAGKAADGVENGLNAVAADLLPMVTTSDRKTLPLLSKVVLALHPGRCQSGYALDVHGGRHAKVRQLTCSWSIANARDLLNSMGGLSSLLPLFPNLLIEDDVGAATITASSSDASLASAGGSVGEFGKPQTIVDATSSTGLGSSLGIYSRDLSDWSSSLDYSLLSAIRSEKEELNGDGCIALLFSVFAKCIAGHRPFQQELVNSGGVEMMEYALSCVPQEILQAEGERCVLALIQLKSAASDLPSLELRITKSLLCNVTIWSKASFSLLSSLMSVTLAAIRAQPDLFMSLLGVKSILDSLEFFLPAEELDVFLDLPIELVPTPKSMDDTPSVQSSAQQSPTPQSVEDTPKGALKNSSVYQFRSAETGSSKGSFSELKLRRPGGISFAHDSNHSNSPSAFSVTTPGSHGEMSGSRTLSRIKRMKSFKLSLTETIEDSTTEEVSQLERIREGEEEQHSTSHAHGDCIHDEDSPAVDLDSLAEHMDVGADTGGSNLSASGALLLSSLSSQKSTPRGRRSSHRAASPNIDPTQSTVESAAEVLEEPVDLPVASPQSNQQRKHLRDCLEAMIVILLQQDGNEKDVSPLLEFMVSCKDKVVLNEIAQILLYLLVEGGPRIATAVIAACSGPEEFASFVLLFLVHQPHEELRCTGIRLLTHFYLRVDVLPPSVMNVSLKRKKGLLARAMSNISHLGSGQGLQRLHLCGGMALLCELVSAHTQSSTERTYSALLELLLTKPGSKCQVTVQYSDLIHNSAQGNHHTNSAQGRDAKRTHSGSYHGSSRVGQREVVFAAHYISPEHVHDEGEDMTNGVVLPIFFELLPKLPVFTQDQIYGDLLALLKHSAGNRDAFCNSPSWHLCLFGMVAQLMSRGAPQEQYGGKVVNTHSAFAELERLANFPHSELPLERAERPKFKKAISKQGELLRSWRSHSTSEVPANYSYDSASNASRLRKKTSGLTVTTTNGDRCVEQEEQDHDLGFALGMKIYATLLLHALAYKGGWREADRAICQSADNEVAYSVSQTVLSHVLNEITFSMKAKYKELQRMAKSSSVAENNEAKDRLENILCLLLSASQLSLTDQHCAISCIPNFHICKLRVHLLNELCRELIARKSVQQRDGEIAPVTQLELRRLLEQTEEYLRLKVTERVSPSDQSLPQPDPINDTNRESVLEAAPAPLGKMEYEAHLDFFHVWSDLAAAEDHEHTPGKESSYHRGHHNGAHAVHPSPSGSVGPLKSTEELLHPLERNHDVAHGKLILVLQTLRYFDAIFWPSEEVPLRNTELLRFNKEGAGILDSGSGVAQQQQSSKKKDSAQNMHMTIYSAAMRMCLFVLERLSPLTHLSVSNSKRIGVLVAAVDKVTTYNTPTHDWLLAAVLHVTIHLQRIALTLEPVYEMLGLTGKVQVQTLGPWGDSYDESPRLDEAESSHFDNVCGDVELMNKLQQYFDSSAGRNLVRNIRISLNTLVDTFEIHNSKLGQTLEERSFGALYILVEHIKADLRLSHINCTDLPPPPSTPDVPPKTLFRTQSRGSKVDSLFVDTNGDIFDRTRSGSNTPQPSPVGRQRSSSDGSTVSELSSVSEFTDKASKASHLSIDCAEESFYGSDIVLVLKWLRHPYFRINSCRSIGLIKAIDALDYLEAKSVSRFSTELKQFRAGLEEQRDLAVKSVGEMIEMKELSLAVYDALRDKNRARETALRNTDNLKLKNVAARWHDCIQTFEGEWSPWSSSDRAQQSIPGQTTYELSKHRDNRLRKMVMTKMVEPANHMDAAYLEGKTKDQQNFEMGVSSEPSTAKDLSLSRAALPFKAPNPAKNNSRSDKTSDDWDDEEGDLSAKSAAEQPLDFGMGLGLFFQGGEKRPQWTQSFQWASDERSLFISDATQISLDQVVGGVVLLTNKCLYFHSRKRVGGLAVTSKPIVDQRWHLDRLNEAYGRRYLLQNCAIELFFTDAPELFLAFNSLSELQKFFRTLRRQSTPLLITPRSLNPRYAFLNSPWTELWRKRQISNFEYLMRLNVIAGRSYNDIAQYPVFPWILADYSSETLDLTDPAVYRPLHKPVGALNPTRLLEFLERYKSFDDEVVPKFMYGSHYSSAGVVIHYMIRQEPFSTLAINLQGGRFDCPDRIFFDINRTWQGCNQAMSDVKELIPELFCCPEALLNSNRLPLGELQEGGQVHDVLLPPWASNAYEFVRINREALESDYVSEHLHEWIDLIFGYKQTGPAALAANNIFYYLTYENAVNIEAIEDPLQREAAKVRPSQLIIPLQSLTV